MHFVLLLLSTFLAALAIERIVTHQVYFDITIGGKPAGRLVIGLFGNNARRTVENFYALSTLGVDLKNYKGSKLYKIFPGFLIHGGDIINNNGTGPPITIYNGPFSAENSTTDHDDRGLVSMVDIGNRTHGSRFFILGGAMNWLNGQDSVIGKVTEGYDVLKKIEAVGSPDGTTKKPVVIADCGAITVLKIYAINWVPEKPHNATAREFKFC